MCSTRIRCKSNRIKVALRDDSFARIIPQNVENGQRWAVGWSSGLIQWCGRTDSLVIEFSVLAKA
eukprot:SAG31_NODE_1075_length_10048_cov_21.627701_3_plen_65_part_00